jgi:hypothetical protein
MQIPINIPGGEKQREFLDQFNAALRQISNGGEGTADFLSDGSFEAAFTGSFRLGPGIDVPLMWRVHKTPTGTLASIEVSPAGEITEPWEAMASQLVTSALTAALGTTRTRFVRRASFGYVGPALDGEYWLPGFRVGPAVPDDEVPASPMVERWVDIDMTLEAIDLTHAEAIAGERGRRVAARLSLLLDVGFERRPFEFRWVMVPTDGDRFANQRCQTMFQPKAPAPLVMPAKGKLCRLGDYITEFPDFGFAKRLKMPRGVRRVLRGVERTPYPLGDAFDRCARLYQVGRVIGRQYPSVFLAYAVAAVDAIIQADRSYKSVRDFMKEHSDTPREAGENLLGDLYGKARSAHFHGGEFPLGEFGPAYADTLMDESTVETSRARWRGPMIIRRAILDWCLKRVAVEEASEDE